MSIDTSQVVNKNIIEMSPTKLMMMVAQKLMKEGSTNKRIIDQSITVLHRLVPECKMIDKRAHLVSLRQLLSTFQRIFNPCNRFQTASIGKVHAG